MPYSEPPHVPTEEGRPMVPVQPVACRVRRLRLRAVLLAIGCLAITMTAGLLPASAAEAQMLRAGASKTDITPEIGQEIIGGFVPFPSTHVHDPLHARCLYLENGEQRLAIVICDLLGIDAIVSQQARALLKQRHGWNPDQVLISATHTHSASSALGKRLEPDKSADPYQAFVARRIADSVTIAMNRAQAAELGIGSINAPEHTFNRRWYLRPGQMPLNPFGELDQVKMNPPAGSESLVEPAGPIDPTLSYIAVRNLNGTPISLFATYSLHYVGGVGQGHLSADYFAVFSEHLRHRLTGERANVSPTFVAMLANGTSGDINNINFRIKRSRQAPYEQIQRVGQDLAERVAKSYQELTFQRDIPLGVAYRELEVAWRHPSPQQLQWAQQILDKGPQGRRDLAHIYAQRTMNMASLPATTLAPVQVLRIGDACIGTMPFEVFCETGLAFREQAPFKHAWMVELAHGYLGYLPTPRQHRLGGYETWLGTSRVEVDTSERLLATLLEMAGKLAAIGTP